MTTVIASIASNELLGARLDRALKRIEQPAQPLAQHPLALELTLDLFEVAADCLEQPCCVLVEQRGDLVHAHAEAPQRQDAVQATDIVLGVEPMTIRRALRGSEQADLVVVVKRADGETGRLSRGLRPSTAARAQRIAANGTPSRSGPAARSERGLDRGPGRRRRHPPRCRRWRFRPGGAGQARQIAERWGTPGATGQGLHAQAHVGAVDDPVEALEEAVALLAESPPRLEHARALVALGGALRRRGRRADSRKPLREGYELALGCGAEAEIAQELFLTVKTAEMHLTHAYRKLGIGGRADLAQSLAKKV